MEQLNYWHWIEIALIASIIIAQIAIFIRIMKKTRSYESMFANGFGISQDEETQKPHVLVIDGDGKTVSNSAIQGTVDNINSYIDNNWGSAVNFSIVENIIERESDSRDEEIQHLIPTPLYLGLAATMIGIILGLFSMGRVGTTQEAIDSLTSLSEIDNLINGVKIAMIASLFGLFWTTLLSTWIYKKAKNNVNVSKNSKLNFLQSQLLLPTQDNTLTGIRECIDNFSRSVGQSITQLVGLAETNISIAQQITNNTREQEHILREIQEFKIAKVTQVLNNLFDRVDANMEAYREFSQYLNLMGVISERLAIFSNRTQNFEDIAREVSGSLSESQRLFHFLSEHLAGVEHIGQQSLEAINAADSHFNHAVSELDREVSARIQALNDGTNAFDSRIAELFEQIGNNLQEITRRHIEELSSAYHQSLPEFKRLEKLDGLVAISEKLDGVGEIKRIEEERSEQIQKVITPLASIERKSGNPNPDIIAAIKEMNKRLEKIEKNTSAPQLRANNGEGNPAPKTNRLWKIILLILGFIAVGALSYFVPKYIEKTKAERLTKTAKEFDYELEAIWNETPTLCEKYKLVSLEESIEVPEAWKEDSLRYRQKLNRFWGNEGFRQKSIMVFESQKQAIKTSRQHDYEELLIEMNQEEGATVE